MSGSDIQQNNLQNFANAKWIDALELDRYANLSSAMP